MSTAMMEGGKKGPSPYPLQREKGRGKEEVVVHNIEICQTCFSSPPPVRRPTRF